MTRRARALVAAGLVGVSSMAGGCGDDPPPPAVDLKVNASWNRSPSAVDQIGFQVEVEVYLAGRRQSCSPLSPELHITVNDRDATLAVGGECDMLFTAVMHAVAPDIDTVVKLHDGDKLLGEATYQGLFPGFGTTHVVSPADGRVRVGEPLAVAVPAGWPPYRGDTLAPIYFYWLDTPASVPPFYTHVNVPGSAALTSFEVAAPMITGSALVVVGGDFSTGNVDAVSCTGFVSCRAWPQGEVFGPVPVEVIP